MIPVRTIAAAQSGVALPQDCVVRSLKELGATDGLREPLHRHDFHYLLLVLHGRGEHKIDFVNHTVGDGALIYLRPGQVHQHYLLPGATGYLLAFVNGFFVPPSGHHAPVIQLSSRLATRLGSILAAVHDELQHRAANYATVVQAQLTILFTLLGRQYPPATTAPTLTALLELIEQHYPDWKQSQDYATALHLSDRQLNHLCRRQLGQTVTQLLHARRLLEAKRLLLATPLTVAEIAYQLGFGDASYFGRFFRRHTGQSPQSFRGNSTVKGG